MDAEMEDTKPPPSTVIPKIEQLDVNDAQTVLQSTEIAETPTSSSFIAPPAPPAKPFKFKYVEAGQDGGCPEGVSNEDWNKIYTAADSRMYNHNGKDANRSKVFRKSGDTRKLALQMLEEKRAKAAAAGESGITNAPKFTKTKSSISKPSKASRTPSINIAGNNKKTSSMSPDNPFAEFAEGRIPLNISEQIKTEGRNRKPSAAASSRQNSPTASMARMSSPKASSPKASTPKAKKQAAKKKGTAATVKKPGRKPSKKKTPVNTTRECRHKSETPSPDEGGGEVEDDSGSDNGEYCLCRKGDDHRLMVYCEGGCKDWFHCQCVGIDEADVHETRHNLLDTFICPNCKIDDGVNQKITTWKPMCRLYNVTGCRMAARVTTDPPSKYCSDEHKKEFWEFIRDNMARQDDAPSMGGRLNRHEVGDIMAQAPTFEEFQKLGKKPRLPVPESHDPSRPLGLDYLTEEEKQRIAEIKTSSEDLEKKITTSQQEQKLAAMIQTRYKNTLDLAKSKADTKDPCGYDNRISFNAPQFVRWATSTEGKSALETGILGPRTAETKEINASIPAPGVEPIPEPTTDIPDELQNICLKPRKKCKHQGWFQTHMVDFKNEEALLREQGRRLAEMEREIVDDAETREASKGYYGENTVERLF